MRNRCILLLIIFSMLSCTETEVFFDSEVSEEYELALILNLNGKDCFYDSPSNTLKYAIDERGLTNFSPLIKFQEYSEVKFNDRPLINNAVNQLGTLDLNTPYTVEIKTNNSISAIKLNFTKTPLIQIITHDKIKNEPKVLGKMHVHYPDNSRPEVSSYIGIEIRGNSSSTSAYSKKSYGFEVLNGMDLDDKVLSAYFDMSANSKWNLDALAVDKSKVRNKTSFEIWNSLPNTSIKSEYVELFLNNNSLGIYRFSELYTEHLLQITSASCLYTGANNTDISLFYSSPDKGPKSLIWHGWEQKHPNPSEKIYWDDFSQLAKLIAQADDETFIANISSHIDLDNVIDYYLFINLFYGYDNVAKNCYLLKRNPSSKFKMLVWDLDATWGRNHRASPLGSDKQVKNNLFLRLLELNPDGYKEKLKERWFLLRANQYDETHILNKFDSNFKEVIDISREISKIQMIDSYSEIEEEQLYINNWVNDRLNFLDNYYNNL